jgi:uncharacterized protein YbjT (DUF2867 family)
MILVTGAGGKTGRAVIRALAAKGETIRALVRRPAQMGQVEATGAGESVVGDMRDPSFMADAVRGVRAVYHICPNMSPDEIAIGQIAITAARAAGVERLGFHSVLHPQTQAMPHHWLKLRVEEQLVASGLDFTILQPAAYMQNLLAFWDQIAREGVYPVPYPPHTRLSLVDLEDVAEAAAIALTGAGHVGATYELVGTGAMSQTEVAASLSRQLGRPVRAQAVPLQTWEQRARSAGLGGYQIETLLKMFRYYARHGLWGSPRALEWLLGRPPTSLDAFIARINQERQKMTSATRAKEVNPDETGSF